MKIGIIKTTLFAALALFSFKANAQNNKKQDTCGSYFKIDQGFVLVSDNTKSTTLTLSYSLEKTSDAASEMNFNFTIKNCKGELKTIMVALKFDATTNTWKNDFVLENNKECPWQLLDFNLSLRNNCGDTFSTDSLNFSDLGGVKKHANHRTKKRFNPNLQTKKNNNENGKDSCDFNAFQMENGSLTLSNDKNVLSILLQLQLLEKKGVAEKGFMLVQMTNCKGEIQNIKIELVFDKISNTWIAKEVIVQPAGCNWVINNYTLLFYNACGDEYKSDAIDVPILKTTFSIKKFERRVKIHK